MEPLPPARFQIEERGREVLIRWSWLVPRVYLIAAILAFFYVVGFSMRETVLARGTGPAKLVFFVHFAVIVGMTYYVLCSFVNRTEVEIGPGHVDVRHGPLPWTGNAQLAGSEIERLFSEERVYRSKNGTTVTYAIIVALRHGTRRTLVSGLEQPGEAVYLERLIEDHLGKIDQPRPGELR